MLSDEYRYKILKALEANPAMSQRELAKELGISLGKVNYCLRALVERGMVKASNFKSSRSKRKYAYILTPRGVEEKALVLGHFLQRKLQEYESLSNEIQSLRSEIRKNVGAGKKGESL